MRHTAIPAIRSRPVPGGTEYVVVRAGRVAGFEFRAGDRLLVGEEAPGALLLLVAEGPGHPMFGRRVRRRLLAEPGSVPASPLRWRVRGAVVGVLRPQGGARARPPGAGGPGGHQRVDLAGRLDWSADERRVAPVAPGPRPAVPAAGGGRRQRGRGQAGRRVQLPLFGDTGRERRRRHAG